MQIYISQNIIWLWFSLCCILLYISLWFFVTRFINHNHNKEDLLGYKNNPFLYFLSILLLFNILHLNLWHILSKCVVWSIEPTFFFYMAIQFFLPIWIVIFIVYIQPCLFWDLILYSPFSFIGLLPTLMPGPHIFNYWSFKVCFNIWWVLFPLSSSFECSVFLTSLLFPYEL